MLAALPASRAEDLERFSFGGRERSYHIHLTDPQYLKQALPLVIVLHGATDNAFGAENMTGFTEKSFAEKFIVVYPNGTNEYDGSTRELTWNGGNCCGYADAENINDVAFIRALVERIRSQYSIDPDRIYVTGFSNGALLAYRLACEMSDVFAAAAPVSGALLPECNPAGPISILALNGTADLKVLYNGGYSPVIYGSKYDEPVSYARDFWTKKNSCEPGPETQQTRDYYHEKYKCSGGTAVEFYRIEDGDHDWPTAMNGLPATDLIWEFFKAHPRNNKVQPITADFKIEARKNFRELGRDFSGITYVPETDRYWVLDDTCALFEMKIEGEKIESLRTVRFKGLDDCEAVTTLPPEKPGVIRMAVTEERRGNVAFFEIGPDTQEIDCPAQCRVEHVINISIFSFNRNTGLEAMTAAPGGVLYIAEEEFPRRMWRTVFQPGKLELSKIWDAEAMLPSGSDIADLTWFDNSLFVLDERAQNLRRVDPETGKILFTYKLPQRFGDLHRYEGVAIVRKNGKIEMVLASEKNEVMVLRKPDQ